MHATEQNKLIKALLTPPERPCPGTPISPPAYVRETEIERGPILRASGASDLSQAISPLGLSLNVLPRSSLQLRGVRRVEILKKDLCGICSFSKVSDTSALQLWTQDRRRLFLYRRIGIRNVLAARSRARLGPVSEGHRSAAGASSSRFVVRC